MTKPPQTLTRDVTVCNQRGLHARASARFVKLAETFDAEVQVTKDGTSVIGTSIMGLMLLAASKGETLTLSAHGPDSEQALEALSALVENKFDETD